MRAWQQQDFSIIIFCRIVKRFGDVLCVQMLSIRINNEMIWCEFAKKREKSE